MQDEDTSSKPHSPRRLMDERAHSSMSRLRREWLSQPEIEVSASISYSQSTLRRLQVDRRYLMSSFLESIFASESTVMLVSASKLSFTLSRPISGYFSAARD